MSNPDPRPLPSLPELSRETTNVATALDSVTLIKGHYRQARITFSFLRISPASGKSAGPA
jgi:hypothetical protein